MLPGINDLVGKDALGLFGFDKLTFEAPKLEAGSLKFNLPASTRCAAKA
jgi:hypothetical protein